MDRICLIVVYASIVVLVTAVALIGPPANERSTDIALALQTREFGLTDESTLLVAGLTDPKSLERPGRAAKQ
jgi:hypothetical protein